MFDNIRKSKTKISNQEVKKSGEVVRKQRGRPLKPNMKTVQIRLHSALNKRLDDFSKELGVAKSQVIAMSLESYFSKGDRLFKIVEVSN